MKTNIVNKTNQSFELKEGNAGAFRFLKQLDAGAKVSIKVDPNATYREYMVATGKKGETIFLTSDDFNEYKVINIEEGPGKDPGTVIYKFARSNPRKPGLSKKTRASEPTNVGGAGCKSNAEGGSNAGVGSDPPASSAAGVGSDPTASSDAGVGSDPPASSAVGVGSVPPASSTAAAGSVSVVSSAVGVASVAPASSAASSKSALGVSNKNERAPWYKKTPKSWFK